MTLTVIDGIFHHFLTVWIVYDIFHKGFVNFYIGRLYFNNINFRIKSRAEIIECKFDLILSSCCPLTFHVDIIHFLIFRHFHYNPVKILSKMFFAELFGFFGKNRIWK